MLALFGLLLPAAAGPRAHTVEVSALIDGSDVLRLDADGAWWSHRHWGLPPHVELDSACVQARSGRDTLSVERHDDHVLIAFADTPNSAARYTVTLMFGGECAADPAR